MGYLIALSVVVVALFVRALFGNVTVFEYERALKYSQGRFKRILGPGKHWFYRPRTAVRKVDVRPRFVPIPGQEVLTSDGVTLKVSVGAEFEIADPAIAINQVADYQAAAYLHLQFSLREIIGQASVDELLENREAFGRRLMELTVGKAQELGLNLITVNVKDIMFPGELKKIFARVVQAKKEAQAALERSRGETAALRNLANAARMIQDNPGLMQLRILQQVGESTGNTFVIGIPTSSTPLPITREPDESRAELKAPDSTAQDTDG